MLTLVARARILLARFGASFSYVGLAIGTLFFAASLTPSLLPRHFAVQGLLSGLALSIGYGVGILIVWLWRYLELPAASPAAERVGKWVTSIAVAIVVGTFLWRATVWQNSIRALMEMEPVETAYPWRVAAIAILTSIIVIGIARGIRGAWRYVDRKINSVLPRRLSKIVSALLVFLALFVVVNDIGARLALNWADAIFAQLDEAIDDEIEPPTATWASGGPESLIDWDTIGRQGKRFVSEGPSRQDISDFTGEDALQPLRVYAGLNSRETTQERAELALQELIRVDGFSRSVLIVATPTGTGWLDPGAVDTLEYLHAGDTAIVSMQYSYLPSWLTILVDPTRAQASATALFETVYGYWKSLPEDQRPRLYVHGLSLGALGSAASADLFTVFEDPIQGGLWSGPPFKSSVWIRATQSRNAGSPMWLPTFRDGSIIRFTGRMNSLHKGGTRWGPMRFAFIQHASDPMSFFAPEVLYRRPEWLVGKRGPDVSPYLRWYPIVTFLQTGFDLPMATSTPHGYGHNFAAASYIDSWIEVTQPKSWTEADTARLKRLFTER